MKFLLFKDKELLELFQLMPQASTLLSLNTLLSCHYMLKQLCSSVYKTSGSVISWAQLHMLTRGSRATLQQKPKCCSHSDERLPVKRAIIKCLNKVHISSGHGSLICHLGSQHQSNGLTGCNFHISSSPTFSVQLFFSHLEGHLVTGCGFMVCFFCLIFLNVLLLLLFGD